MKEHAGLACALSVLIVGIFAIILHDKNPPPVAEKSLSARTSRATEPNRVPATYCEDSGSGREMHPAPRNPQPPTATAQPSPTPASVPSPNLETTGLTKLETTKVVAEDPPRSLATSPEPRETTPTARPTPVRTSFTIVQEGEKLTDVAARVYGSADSAESLWRANRDQVPLIDSPLPRGTLLRTP